MPALLFVMRIGRVFVPLPWFPLWLVALPLSLAAWFVGEGARVFTRARWTDWARMAPRAAWLITALHGLKVDISGSDRGENVFLMWL